MEGTAAAVCEILKYLIIHWKCETAGVPKGALVEGQLVISIEALNSKHWTNTLHCVTTIASTGSIYDGLILKKFLKEIQSMLRGFSAKLNWTSEEASYFQNTSRVSNVQMTCEETPSNFDFRNTILNTVSQYGRVVDEKPRTLMTDSLVIKNFLHKISIVQPKIKFNFSVKMNEISSIEMFGVQNEPTLSLWNGIALVVNSRHYVRFLYGPSGLPLVLPTQEQPATAVFKDTSYFINWKKHHLCMVPNLDLNLDRDFVLPDVSYQVECTEEDQSQNMDPQGQTLLLFLFVDFHSEFPVQHTELWGVHSWLTAHLSAVLVESHSAVQDSLQGAVDQALEQHQQAAQICQKWQASLSVAVHSITSIVTGSTSSSFRKTCLQALQAANTQDFGTKLHGAFHEVTRRQFLHHCSYEARQHLLPENAAQSTEDARDNSCPDLGASGTRRQVGKRRRQRGSVRRRVAETPASLAAGAAGPPPAVPSGAGSPAGPRSPGGSGAGPGGGLEDALWRREVSNLSEWLRPGPAL